jgi:uncharacterized membrane protein YfcA
MLGNGQEFWGGLLALGLCSALLSGAIRYKLAPSVEVQLSRAGIIAIGAVVGALLGSTAATHLPGHVLKRIFAVFLLIVAARMLLTQSSHHGGPPDAKRPHKISLSRLANGGPNHVNRK